MDDVFLIKPTDQSFTITDRWNTNVVGRPVGNEQRSMLFTWPRTTITKQCIAHDYAAVAWLNRHIWKNIGKVWGCPIWADGTYLTSQASSGQPVLSVGSSSQRRFFVGGGCIVINDSNPFSYETGIIQSVSGGITLTENLSNTWPSGSLVYPLITSRIESVQDFKYIDDTKLYIDIDFVQSVEEEDDTVSVTVTQSVQQYQGYDVFLHSPSISSPVSKVSKNVEVVEFLGPSYSVEKQEESDFNFNYKYIKANRSQIWELWTFFNCKRGMLTPFWVPSFKKDFQVTSTFLSTDTTINITDIEYSTYWLPNDVNGRYVYFRFPDGTYVFRSIQSATTGSVTLDSATGKNGDDLINLKMGFLYFVRFNQDEIKIQYNHNSNEIADIDLSFKTLAFEAPTA